MQEWDLPGGDTSSSGREGEMKRKITPPGTLVSGDWCLAPLIAVSIHWEGRQGFIVMLHPHAEKRSGGSSSGFRRLTTQWLQGGGGKECLPQAPTWTVLVSLGAGSCRSLSQWGIQDSLSCKQWAYKQVAGRSPRQC